MLPYAAKTVFLIRKNNLITSTAAHAAVHEAIVSLILVQSGSLF